MLCVGWSRSHWRLTTAGRCSSTPCCELSQRASLTCVMYLWPSPRNMSSRMPMTSVRNGDHRRRLAHRLAVRDLGRRLVELLGHQAEQVAARAEGVARARGLVPEDRDAEAGVEDARRDVGRGQVLEDLRRQQHRANRRLGVLPREQEVLVVEARRTGDDLGGDGGHLQSCEVAILRSGDRAKQGTNGRCPHSALTGVVASTPWGCALLSPEPDVPRRLGYNRHGSRGEPWRCRPARGSVPTKSSPRLAPAEWARSTRPATRASTAASPSRFSRPTSAPMLTAAPASSAKRGPSPA